MSEKDLLTKLRSTSGGWKYRASYLALEILMVGAAIFLVAMFCYYLIASIVVLVSNIFYDGSMGWLLSLDGFAMKALAGVLLLPFAIYGMLMLQDAVVDHWETAIYDSHENKSMG